MTVKQVCILTLNYNGKGLLQECLDSYLGNDYSNFKMVVIDNGSVDGSQDFVRNNYPQVTLIENGKNLGYAAGFNVGLRYAFDSNNFDYAVISNNDVKADKQVVSELVKVAEGDKSIGFVTGKVYYYDTPEVLQTVGYIPDDLMWVSGHMGNNEKDIGQYDRVEERHYSDDIFILVSREVYQATDGYDEEFQFQSEQFDWQIRAKKQGHKIYYTPFAKIWHKDSITIGKISPFKTYFDVRNSFVVRLKHRDKAYLKKYFKWYFKAMVMKPLLRNIIKANFKMAFSVFRGFLSAYWWGITHKKISFLRFR